ncbi:MAG TPA: hypothetical protein VJI33_00765 [Candidatus Paceibacterota bacterium]
MDQENQPVQAEDNKGSKKGLYVIVGIVILVLIVWAVKSSMRSVTGVDIDRNFDGSATYSNEQGSVTVGSNKLPDNWPADAPKYGNATIQYSGSSNPQTGAEGSSVMFFTSDSAQKVTDFYKKELASNGWTIEQTVNAGPSTILSAKKDQRTFGVYITDAGDGQVSVTIGIEIPKTN